MVVPSSDAPPPQQRGGLIPPEWPAQAADIVVDTIAKVRDRTTRPAQVLARGLVYGLIAAVLGGAALVLLLILMIRMWSNWVPGDVWILYALIAVAFIATGAVFLGRANRATPAD